MKFWSNSLFHDDEVGNSFEEICLALSDNKASYLKPDEFGQKLHSWAKKNVKKPINTLCLFSGAGGLDIGFHDSGFNVVECVEIESQFVKSLIENKDEYFPNTNIVCEDIRNYFPTFSKPIDFIIGGPPCQSFSKAGIRASGAKGINDERGTLFEEYVRLLKQLQPKGFLFENVTGILSAQKGRAIIEIVEAFEEVGYNLTYRVLDTADYGVPQNRERLILVGQKNDDFKFPSPTHGVDSIDEIEYYSSGQALKGINAKIDSGLNGRYGHLLNQIPPGLNYSYFTEKMGHPNPIFAWRSKFSDFLYKADPDLPVRTLKASGGQYTGPFHWSNRHFTVDELKRLQTFPDNYTIVGGRTIGAKQIGNSVPPQFARILGISVLEQIFDIKLPFELNKLEKHHQLSFRKLKSKRTKYYAEKARVAISEIDEVAKKSIRSRKFWSNIDEKLIYKESKKVDEGYKMIHFKVSPKKWSFILGADSGNNQKFKVRITSADNKVFFNEIESIEFVSDSFELKSYLILWKAFERELIQNQIRADLVQLNGYYQYKPKFKINIDFNQNEIISSTWRFIDYLSQDENYNDLRALEEMSMQYDMDTNEILNILKELKEIGFEIRNSNTNSEIPKNHFLIPYLFPSMNRLSLQLKTSL